MLMLLLLLLLMLMLLLWRLQIQPAAHSPAMPSLCCRRRQSTAAEAATVALRRVGAPLATVAWGHLAVALLKLQRQRRAWTTLGQHLKDLPGWSPQLDHLRGVWNRMGLVLRQAKQRSKSI